MRTELFDFDLPEDRIALHPLVPRDAARMLVVRPGAEQPYADLGVRNLVDELKAGDALVFNDTRVVHSALEGLRHNRGEPVKLHINLHRRIDAGTWHGFVRPARRLRAGDVVIFDGVDGFEARVTEKRDGGDLTFVFSLAGSALVAAIAAVGRMPLPPYIENKRRADQRDEADYQTVYATRDGAVAAPTAGLHFTQNLLEQIDAKGIARHFVTLHVGAGTFLPVKVEDTNAHQMHAEWGEISKETANALNAVRGNGGRIVAVGTTSLRILESAAREDGTIAPFSDDTSIFITPGYRFKAVDVLMTNFHLPCSTLFMLVSAFSGLDVMKQAYAHAVKQGYRFFSYGDASLLYRSDGSATTDRL